MEVGPRKRVGLLEAKKVQEVGMRMMVRWKVCRGCEGPNVERK